MSAWVTYKSDAEKSRASGGGHHHGLVLWREIESITPETPSLAKLGRCIGEEWGSWGITWVLRGRAGLKLVT